MTSEIHELSAFQRDLLVAIDTLHEEPSGQDILDRLQPRYDSDISGGRLYPNLDKLDDMGLVSREQKTRLKNSYELTDRGQEVRKKHIEFVGGSV